MINYEESLDQNPILAVREGSRHFEKESAVFKALVRTTGRLDEMGIPYALVGGMALFLHGFRRFTEDVGFPDPETVVTDVGGVRCIGLRKLTELKLASGTAPGRHRDIADVQDMMRVLDLPADLAGDLDPSVRDSYTELWNELQAGPSDR